MRTIATFAVLAISGAIIVPRYADRVHGAAPAEAPKLLSANSPQNPMPASSNSRSVTISRADNGHFAVTGRVDGRRLEFMVDTGASVIALTERDAAMLGIHPAASEYTAMVRTANGTVRAAPVELARVEVEDLVVHDVAAMVLPEGALSDNLLGLSFLSRLRRFEYADGRLVLEQ